METAYLLNPSKRRKRTKKYGKKRGHRAGRTSTGRFKKGHRKVGRGKRKKNNQGWFAKRGKKSVEWSGRFSHPKRGSYLRTPTVGKRHKNRGRRHRNPGILGGLTLGVPELLPFRLPLPGIIGTVVNGVVQGVFAGGLVFGGYVISGAVVDFIAPKEKEGFLGKWTRPVLFGAVAGLTGGVVSMLAPKGKKAMWGLLAAAGPGLRALAGTVMAISPETAGKLGLSSLADYLQVGDDYAGGPDQAIDGVDDYLQVDGMYEAGLGEGDDEMGAIYEAGMGEREVIGM